jgi:hypothetical protein
MVRGERKMSNYKHGMRRTKFYQVWKGLKQRCNNPNSKFYFNYGGRGISVCDRWNESYQNFHDDMFSEYKEGLELDRIDNNGNYCKENCRFVTKQVNTSNRRKQGSLLRGVQKMERGFKAQIVVDNRNYYIGFYKTEIDAHNAYMEVRKEWHGR